MLQSHALWSSSNVRTVNISKQGQIPVCLVKDIAKKHKTLAFYFWHSNSGEVQSNPIANRKGQNILSHNSWYWQWVICRLHIIWSYILRLSSHQSWCNVLASHSANAVESSLKCCKQINSIQWLFEQQVSPFLLMSLVFLMYMDMLQHERTSKLIACRTRIKVAKIVCPLKKTGYPPQCPPPIDWSPLTLLPVSLVVEWWGDLHH